MRAKLILPNLVVVLALGFGAYSWLGSDLHEKAAGRLRSRLLVTGELLRRSESLRGHELLADVGRQAMSRDMIGALAPVDAAPAEGETPEQAGARARQARTSRAFQAVEVYSELWGVQHGRKPDLVFLTDGKGVVLARNTTPTSCPYDRTVAESIPVVGAALRGAGAYSLWSPEGAGFGRNAAGPDRCALVNTGLLEMAAAPVWAGDRVSGVLVIGFEVSNGVAGDKSRLLGFDVAVSMRGRTYSTSLKSETARQALEGQLGAASGEMKGAVGAGRPSDVIALDVEGERYAALIVPAVNADAEDEIAYVIMGSFAEADFFDGSLFVLAIATVIAALLVLAAGLALAGHFLRPIMAIEEGLLKVINGDYGHRFDVKSSEVGGLCFRINQLIGVLTGEDEPAEDEERRP